MVDGTDQVSLKLIGDVVSSIVTSGQSLERLVQQPTGCGEQNMITMAPLISVAAYLKQTDQYSPEIKQKVETYLKEGYQNQQKYRHPNDPDKGLFSVGKPNRNRAGGGTWLSAYVLSNFVDMVQHELYEVNENDLKETYTTLMQNRMSKEGKFSHDGTKLRYEKFDFARSVPDDQVILTSFVAIALAKADQILFGSSPGQIERNLSKPLEYITKSFSGVNLATKNTYSMALSLYALNIISPDRYDGLKRMLNVEIDRRKKIKDGQMYWLADNDDCLRTRTCESLKSSAANLELTAYVLLAELSNREMNIAKAESIAKWLNSKKNANQGFYSTQVS